jgi:hypothetical protein
MRKAGLVAGLLVLAVCGGWGQSSELPPVIETAESIKVGFRALIENIENFGYAGDSSRWASSREDVIRHYTEYLDGLFVNMTYDNAKAYVSTIRTKIDQLDRQELSKRENDEFERFLQCADPYHDFEVSAMIDRFKVWPFPESIILNYDHSKIDAFEEQLVQEEQLLTEYRSQLAALPTLDAIRSQLYTVQDELKKPRYQRDSRRFEQMKNNEINLQIQLSNTYITRLNLTENIRRLENSLKNAEYSRTRLVASLEQPARQAFINSVFEDLYNFYSWESFFRGECTSIRDFLILRNTRGNLYRLVEEIPQRQAQAYEQKVDAFCKEWGI